MVELGKRIEELERPKAKERHGARNDLPQHRGNFPQGSEGKTRDKVAAALGVSGKAYEKANKVVEAAEKEPERFGDLPARMDATEMARGAAARPYRPAFRYGATRRATSYMLTPGGRAQHAVPPQENRSSHREPSPTSHPATSSAPHPGGNLTVWVPASVTTTDGPKHPRIAHPPPRPRRHARPAQPWHAPAGGRGNPGV